MGIDFLKQIIIDQKEAFNRKRELIERDIHLDKYLTTRQVVIISGIRRSGKSSLMYLIKEKLNLDEGDYCYFNFDDERILPDLSLPETIFNLHLQEFGKEPILFFDEIQHVEKWEKFINRVHEKGIKVFITGSNAGLLSSEIASSLTGRNKVLELYPFSFSEFLRFHHQSFDLKRLSSTNESFLIKWFLQFMNVGGFPLAVSENDPEIVDHYFRDILYRDIIARYRLIQVNEIKEIALYFASNTGKIFSYRSLQAISGVKSTSSIKDYLGYYRESYLFFYVSKFDFSVKKQVMNPKKVYAIDVAIPKRLGFQFSDNHGRLLENLVFIELQRRGKEVFYHKGDHECDFVIKKGNKILEVIQVCWELDARNVERETRGLYEAMQLYGLSEGLIITMYYNDMQPSLVKGAKIIPCWKWLLI
jgi:predicted AAA+ superfamily ATPase